MWISVLSRGQAACRLERTDAVCWCTKLICEFISYFPIHSERQVHSWNFDIRTPTPSTELLCVLERKELLDSSSPCVPFYLFFNIFFWVQPVPWSWSELKWQRAISASFPKAALCCHHSLCPWTGWISAQPLVFHNRCINFAWGT